MGGSGGRTGSYFSARDAETLREEATKRLEQSRIDAEVNQFLQEELADLNDRDVETTSTYVEEIESALEAHIESFDRLLFGGSIAKHTYVDGLSDIDSLVVLKEESLAEETPAEVRDKFRQLLTRQLPQGEIRNIRTGAMAVTVEYRDGTEIQLLPAVQSRQGISISSADGSSWTHIQPREFTRQLTECNRRQGNAVVPAIKLAKAITASRLGGVGPSGYHMEALAVAAFEDYSGPRTPKAMVTHLFESASRDVLRPIRDVTAQSPYVDEDLGPANSAARRNLSGGLQRIGSLMSKSPSIADWQALFE